MEMPGSLRGLRGQSPDRRPDLRAQEGQKIAKASKATLPVFKQYRESDGQFYFKLVDAQGNLLLQSQGFASPKDVGQAIRALQQGDAELAKLAPAPGVRLQDVASALQQMRDAA